MFEELSLKLESALKKVTGQGKLTEANISDTLREIRRILLDADVNYKVAKDFIENVKVKALGKEVLVSISPGPVSYTHLRAHETVLDIVCRLLLEKKTHVNNNH